MKQNLKSLPIVILITLVLLELTSRFVIPALFPKSLLLSLGNANADPLWIVDAQSGWTRKPNATSLFTDGIFAGHVNNDALGNRINADESTFNANFPTIFFLGDSTAASLEVNNHQTVAAFLEQDIRASGLSYNVLNLGVRGYGSDQAYWRAKKIAQTIKPDRIIYLYNGNDILNNNSLKLRAFAKPAFISPSGYANGTGNFERIETRVKAFKERELIVLDAQCIPHPTLFTSNRGSSSKLLSSFGAKTKEFLSRNVIFYRIARNAMRYNKNTRQARANIKSATDQKQAPRAAPKDDLYHRLNVLKNTYQNTDSGLFTDRGAMRVRCSAYFDAQIGHILQQMANIKGVQAVDVVSFPHINLENSPARNMFEKFLSDKLINSYIDTPAMMVREGHQLADFVCHRGDNHLCDKGNRWIADKILESLMPELNSAQAN